MKRKAKHSVPGSITAVRRRAEVVVKNQRFMADLKRSKDLANLRVEHARLNSLLHTQLMPGLRQRVKERADTVSDLLK